MRVIEGYTMVPNKAIREELKALDNKEMRLYIALYHTLNFTPYRADNVMGEVITDITTLKRILGYAKKNLSVAGLKELLYSLQNKGIIRELIIKDNGAVRLTLNTLIRSYEGLVMIYNKRILKGAERLKDGDLKVFLYLLTYGGYEEINLSFSKIAKDLNVPEPTVKDNINRLVKKGLINKINHFKINNGKCITHNTYTILERVCRVSTPILQENAPLISNEVF